MEGVKWRSSRGGKKDLFHVIHKVPAGDSPYVRAKHLQLIEKDLDSSIVWFWKAINASDRVDSALKDMAVVMTQQDRAEEAIEAIKSFRHFCSKQAQESLDNLLIDLYKKCGMVEEQIELLKQKLRMIYQGEAFNGKPTKTARSHGKRFQLSIRKETIHGNLGWAYMQQNNFVTAEAVYRKAQMIEPDAKKACNLGICLMKQGHFDDARCVLLEIVNHKLIGCDERKVSDRANELLYEIESRQSNSDVDIDLRLEEKSIVKLDHVLNESCQQISKRLPIFEEISTHRDQTAF
ncbi:protein SULFUR DEFICIENCY-INDUCED 1-like isoform X2 [Phalaenopsis equestris]|uniref:protein SULFUR DEFICIENCY-INDUCED 1-like isoform X2 n=1 Tax=Phalaenopsis equestris TaxID=78828 RepID=UPI0009E642E9|nr:protein SULFUR DEFICIENCY-INDUCED 1-like isoform X2 [Phalaenopsis equestris]